MNQNFTCSLLEESDYPALIQYLDNLSLNTQKRFHPHEFTLENLKSFYLPQNYNQGFVVYTSDKQTIIAYAVIHYGYLLHDASRLTSYALQLNHLTDCVYAPSVADQFQGKGIGKYLFEFVMNEIRGRGFKRIFLWGGVQADNHQAIKFYNTLGFIEIGQFEYQGMNMDMLKKII